MDQADTLEDFQFVLAQYADEIRRTRFGTFHGTIRDGKVVIFAVEQEWRPHLTEERRAARNTRE